MAKKDTLTDEQKAAIAFAEEAAKALINIAEGMRGFLNGKLNKRAIILLVTAAAGSHTVTKAQVESVLDAVARLDKEFVKK